jgi:hypothetical protein
MARKRTPFAPAKDPYIVSQPSETSTPSDPSYAYKASLVGSAHQFTLEDDAIVWHAGRRSGRWRYADIVGVRMSYRPMSMQTRRFRTDLEHRGGDRLVVMSTTWQTVTLMVAQDRDYRAFILDLHRRIAASGARVALIGGIGPVVHTIGIVGVALVSIAIAGLLARAIATGAYGGALFIAGFAALFGWQIGGFLARNKPRPYTFDALPQDLLP